MAIKDPRVVTSDGKVEVSMEEFKKWLKKFDSDRDGRISVEELRDAIHATGGWFCKWKAKRMVKAVDSNKNGVIDDSEMNKLLEFAQKELGFKIVSY